MPAPLPPPRADDPHYEVLFDGRARVSLYAYNDILLRRGDVHADASAHVHADTHADTHGAAHLEASEINREANGGRSVYLQIDGWTPPSTGGAAPAARLVWYARSEFFEMFRLDGGGESSCDAYRLPAGDALRHVVLLRERAGGDAASLGHPIHHDAAPTEPSAALARLEAGPSPGVAMCACSGPQADELSRPPGDLASIEGGEHAAGRRVTTTTTITRMTTVLDLEC